MAHNYRGALGTNRGLLTRQLLTERMMLRERIGEGIGGWVPACVRRAASDRSGVASLT